MLVGRAQARPPPPRSTPHPQPPALPPIPPPHQRPPTPSFRQIAWGGSHRDRLQSPPPPRGSHIQEVVLVDNHVCLEAVGHRDMTFLQETCQCFHVPCAQF